MAGDITRNISRSEMCCECGCDFDACDITLMKSLQHVVDHFSIVYEERGKIIIHISGPNRCILHNEEVQAKYYASKKKTYKPYSSRSKHINGTAADFTLYLIYPDGKRRMIPALEVYSFMDNMWADTYGMGLYYNRCHLDIRKEKKRWKG